MKNKQILLATCNVKVNQALADKVIPRIGYELVGIADTKENLISMAKKLNPDIVVVTKLLIGHMPLLETLLILNRELPNIRIVYFAGQINKNNKDLMKDLGTLVVAGIYDIITEKRLSLSYIEDILQHPMKREDVEQFLKYMDNNSITEDEIVEIQKEDEGKQRDVERDGYENVYLVSSIKPGTGKTFMSSNLALAIAKYGKPKPDGSKPKVAIIEGDLQNLSLGTILEIEERDDKNLKSVMDSIGSIIKDDSLVEDKLKIKSVNEKIENSFLPYSGCNNLHALVGSQLTMEQVENIKAEYYIYLIEYIRQKYDIVLVDSNSSLAHTTTFPLLKLCNTAFYIIDLDFNNVRNNSRYKNTLKKIDAYKKIKYVLNQDIDRDNATLIDEKLVENIEFGIEDLKNSGFNVIASVPEIPKVLFLNRLYNGTPIILDDSKFTLKARLEISKVANGIWPIENLDFLQESYNKELEKAKSNKKHFFK